MKNMEASGNISCWYDTKMSCRYTGQTVSKIQGMNAA